MDAVNFLPAVVALIIAFMTSVLLTKRFGSPSDQGRFSSIDGLRGYLAFFVFLHHSCIWYFYLRTGRWELPPSNIYTHFGQSAVALFFMITGFLFFSKIIDGRAKNVDWTKLFISRILRLAPLYFFMVLILFLIIAIISKGILNEPAPVLFKNLIRWLSFTILGAPQINGIKNTSQIVAGVTWSLPFEWFFYLSLPLMALTLRVKPPVAYVALAVFSLLYFEFWRPRIYYLAFLGGIIASFLARSSRFRTFATKKASSFVVIGCIGVVVGVFPSAYAVIPLSLLAVAFALVASGNDLFGILATSASRTLGELAYSIYLLHGIFLFTTFTCALGIPASANLSPLSHWFIVFAMTPVLIFFCFLTFRFIERPAMQSTNSVTAWIRSNVLNRSKNST